MADDFGSHLKHERELRGVSLEEIASVTKIHVRYLQALEKNDFDRLPGEVFIKGFVRSYGKAIGSNVEELLTAYDAMAGRERRETQKKTRPQSEEETQKQVRFVNALVGGFLLLFLVLAVWFLTRPKPSSQELQTPPVATQPRPAPEPEVVLEVPAEEEPETESGESPESTEPAEPEPGEPAAGESPPKQETAPTPPPQEKPVTAQENGAIIQPLQDQQVKKETGASVPKPGDTPVLELVIRVKENSWFNLTADGAREQDFILPAGTSKTFRAQSGFRMTIGNRRGTQLILNGKEIPLPESPDNVVRNFQITEKSTG